MNLVFHMKNYLLNSFRTQKLCEYEAGGGFNCRDYRLNRKRNSVSVFD